MHQTVCRLLNVADAKLRKKFIQSWKDTHIAPHDLATSYVSSIVLLKLLTCVDDTKLLKEAVLTPVLNFDAKAEKPKSGENGDTIRTLAEDKTARKLFLLLLCDDSTRYLSQEEKRLFGEISPTRSVQHPLESISYTICL